MCPYSKFFWSVFSSIRTEYGDILRISPYSVRMRENMDQKNSECGHFSCSVFFKKRLLKIILKTSVLKNLRNVLKNICSEHFKTIIRKIHSVQPLFIELQTKSVLLLYKRALSRFCAFFTENFVYF